MIPCELSFCFKHCSLFLSNYALSNKYFLQFFQGLKLSSKSNRFRGEKSPKIKQSIPTFQFPRFSDHNFCWNCLIWKLVNPKKWTFFLGDDQLSRVWYDFLGNQTLLSSSFQWIAQLFYSHVYSQNLQLRCNASWHNKIIPIILKFNYPGIKLHFNSRTLSKNTFILRHWTRPATFLFKISSSLGEIKMVLSQ